MNAGKNASSSATDGHAVRLASARNPRYSSFSAAFPTGAVSRSGGTARLECDVRTGGRRAAGHALEKPSSDPAAAMATRRKAVISIDACRAQGRQRQDAVQSGAGASPLVLGMRNADGISTKVALERRNRAHRGPRDPRPALPLHRGQDDRTRLRLSYGARRDRRRGRHFCDLPALQRAPGGASAARDQRPAELQLRPGQVLDPHGPVLGPRRHGGRRLHRLRARLSRSQHRALVQLRPPAARCTPRR